MNHFQLFALGITFDPDAYLASTPLKFDGLWHKGESGHNHPKSNGIFKVLGDGLSLPLSAQERIAIDFLAANREALKALAKYPGVTGYTLGLQRNVVLESGVSLVGFCMGPSALLMWHALDIGIEPTFYVSLERRGERKWEDDAEPDVSPDIGNKN